MEFFRSSIEQDVRWKDHDRVIETRPVVDQGICLCVPFVSLLFSLILCKERKLESLIYEIHFLTRNYNFKCRTICLELLYFFNKLVYIYNDFCSFVEDNTACSQFNRQYCFWLIVALPSMSGCQILANTHF